MGSGRPGGPREVSLGRQMPRSPRSPNPVALSVLGTASRCLRAADYFFWAGPRSRGPEVPLQRPRPLPPLLQGLPEAGSLPGHRRVPVRPGRSAEHSWSRLHGAARSACCCLAATRRPRPCAVPRCLAGEPTPATQPSTSFYPQLLLSPAPDTFSCPTTLTTPGTQVPRTLSTHPWECLKAGIHIFLWLCMYVFSWGGGHTCATVTCGYQRTICGSHVSSVRPRD